MKSFRKYWWLILVWAALVISVNKCNAQVQIPDSVARFFLERHEIAKYLEKENEIIKQGLATLEKTIKGKDFIIKTYEEDAKTYSDIILLEREKTSVCEQYKAEAEKELKKQRRKTKLITIGAGILAAIAIIKTVDD